MSLLQTRGNQHCCLMYLSIARAINKFLEGTISENRLSVLIRAESRVTLDRCVPPGSATQNVRSYAGVYVHYCYKISLALSVSSVNAFFIISGAHLREGLWGLQPLPFLTKKVILPCSHQASRLDC